MSRHSPLGSVAALAVAFGVVEAATVVVLRRHLDPLGTLFPDVRLPADLLRIEQAREAATLLVLTLAARLAAGDRVGRWAVFLVLFGVWDIAYYAALRLFMGWPTSWRSPDLLFLLPVPWRGPVYAPIAVSATMVVCGLLATARRGGVEVLAVRARHALAAGLGALLIVASFVAPAAGGRYRWEWLVLGEAIGILAYVDAWRRSGGRG